MTEAEVFILGWGWNVPLLSCGHLWEPLPKKTALLRHTPKKKKIIWSRSLHSWLRVKCSSSLLWTPVGTLTKKNSIIKTHTKKKYEAEVFILDWGWNVPLLSCGHLWEPLPNKAVLSHPQKKYINKTAKCNINKLNI